MNGPSTDPVVQLAAAIEKCLSDLVLSVREFQLSYAKSQPARDSSANLSEVKSGNAAVGGKVDWLNTKEAAEYLGLQTQTLRKWRNRGTAGPKTYKIGGAVRYKRSELELWLEDNARGQSL